jgi:Coat F domain.
MDDKCIMENLLLTTKGALDLYMHGAVESSTDNVHQAFTSAFDDTLCMEDNLYKQMSSKGWYQTEAAPSQKLQQIKQKFSPTC